MNILICNDDGLDSLGLLEIARAFSAIGKVTVCAPDSQRSCMSHSMTIRGKVRLEKVEDYLENVTAYKCWGTAVDCVRFAVRCLMDEKPDLVISGINTAANMGSDIIYSATIACAREGLLNNIPSLAVATDVNNPDYGPSCRLALDIARKLLKDPDNLDYFLSLNVPKGEIKDLLVCDGYGFRDYNENYRFETIDGLSYITINDTCITDDFDPEDMNIETNAFKKGYATLTAYKVDQIDKDACRKLEEKYKKGA